MVELLENVFYQSLLLVKNLGESKLDSSPNAVHSKRGQSLKDSFCLHLPGVPSPLTIIQTSCAFFTEAAGLSLGLE